MSVKDLKRDLLLFDQLEVLGLSEMLDGDGSLVPRLDDAAAADCQYLLDRGLLLDGPAHKRAVCEYVHDRLSELPFDEDDDGRFPLTREALASASDFERAHLFFSSGMHPAGILDHDTVMPPGFEMVVAYAERLFAPGVHVALMRGDLRRSDLRILERTFIMAPDTDSTHRVAEVVLGRMPMPGDEVPLEDVMGFSRDPETKRRVGALRLWMARTAMSDAPSAELELEIDTMLHEFESHMRVADMRAEVSALSLLVSIPLEVIQELVHLRPKAAFDAVFAVRTRRADRLEAELQAPGQELAYIRSAAREFAHRASDS